MAIDPNLESIWKIQLAIVEMNKGHINNAVQFVSPSNPWTLRVHLTSVHPPVILEFETVSAAVCCSSPRENQLYAVAEYAMTNLLFVLILLHIAEIDLSLVLAQTVTNIA